MSIADPLATAMIYHYGNTRFWKMVGDCELEFEQHFVIISDRAWKFCDCLQVKTSTMHSAGVHGSRRQNNDDFASKVKTTLPTNNWTMQQTTNNSTAWHDKHNCKREEKDCLMIRHEFDWNITGSIPRVRITPKREVETVNMATEN